ncbi:DNA-binding LacI/PurR family transcriptional regulator [Salinibacterium sp. CAN_S4]|uniref:LacI family DNA-binding transcriptional regulator n=1 Tax=Salinibacterium sp. CAN_S4 TaxID=2787727 RepID=UPI0018EFE140
MSALSDVARLADVSKATASRALSGNGYVSVETRDRVVAAAATIGYVVSSNASSLVTGHTKNVGVVIPFINRWFFGEVLEGIETALIAAGYDLTLYRLSADDAARRRVFEYFLVRKRVDAVIAVGIELTGTEVDLLRSLGKPIVGIGGAVEGMATLSIDDVAASALITELLINLGHTRIMHVGGSQHKQLDFRVHSQRLKGFTQAMRAAGLPYDDESFRPTEISIEGGYAAGLSILADPRSRPSAIVAGADEVAIGIIVAARQLGIQVPAQLSVVGIDGHDLAPMFGLTTLAQHPHSQGTMAVRLVLEELTELPDRPASNWHTFPVSLEVRRSTTAPPLP